VEADVYVWRYALLVVHARKEEEESTQRGWLKDKEKLQEFVHIVDESNGINRKRAHLANDEILDAALYTWFIQQQQKGAPLSEPILCTQAEKFDKQPTGQSSLFKASSGWLCRFCKHRGISQTTISGEIRSSDNTAASLFPAQLKELNDGGGHVPEQIYDTDETGTNYKMWPDKLLKLKSDEHGKEGFKAIK